MPFMIGKQPIRRTLRYLESGKLHLKDRINVVTINYNTRGEHHHGARDFIFWFLPQVQYKNPNVQIATFKNMTPTPFMKAYFQDGNSMLIDIDNKNKEQILAHLTKVIGKSEDELLEEIRQKEKKANPANFGVGCSRNCICTIPGQIPCTGTIPLPYHMRGKYKFGKKDEE